MSRLEPELAQRTGAFLETALLASNQQGPGTSIAVFDALLFKDNSWIYTNNSSLLLLSPSMSILASPCLSWHYCRALLGFHCALVPLVSGVLHWISLNHPSQCWMSFSSIGASPSLSCILLFCTWSLLVRQISNATYAFSNTNLLNISSFCGPYIPTFYTIQHGRSNCHWCSINLPFTFCSTLLSHRTSHACIGPTSSTGLY